MKNFAVFASGNGSNLQAIIDSGKERKIKGKLALVFSDKAEAFALTRAKKAGIHTATLSPKDFPSREVFDQAVIKVLRAYKIDYIVLAGYMRLLSAGFIKAYKNKIINIHPALLPSFKGAHGIKDAFDAGVKVTGVTVHMVVEEMDAGAIIAQRAVEVKPKDTVETLAKRIHQAEHELYPSVVNLFVSGKIKVNKSRVTIV